MRLNPQNPNAVEERLQRRARLQIATLETIRTHLRDALSEIAPPEWGAETLEKMVAGKLVESQRIIDALSLPELENDFAMQRHADRVAAETRSEVRQMIAEGWTEPSAL